MGRCLDGGVLAGAAYDFVYTLEVAVGGTSAVKVREDTIAVRIAESAITLILGVVIKRKKSIETIGRTEMQWAGTFVIKSHATITAMA